MANKTLTKRRIGPVDFSMILIGARYAFVFKRPKK